MQENSFSIQKPLAQKLSKRSSVHPRAPKELFKELLRYPSSSS
jgi:hypothetical protein